jgi:uncharacterized protein (TIGR03086 family)
MSSGRRPGPPDVETNPTLDLTATAAEVSRLVAGVRDDQLAGPTPCAGTPVAGLLDHLVGLTVAFRMGAEKQPMTGAPRASADELPADWRTRLPEQLDALAAAWRDPAAWEGMTEVAGARLPGGAMGVVAANEVLVHGWDLAAATCQAYTPDPAVAERCLAFVVDLAAGAPEMRDSMYAPVVPVAADAPVLDRLLGQTGRDPGWRAG